MSIHGAGRASYTAGSLSGRNERYWGGLSTSDLESGGILLPNYIQTDNDTGLYHNMTILDGYKHIVQAIGNKTLNKDTVYYIKQNNTDMSISSRMYNYYVSQTYFPRTFDVLTPATNINDTTYTFTSNGITKGVSESGITLIGTPFTRPVGMTSGEIFGSQLARTRTLWELRNQWWEKPSALYDPSETGWTNYSIVGWKEDNDAIIKEHYPAVGD
jgi:hypothetical protein